MNILGGEKTLNTTTGWCFWINLPVGGVTLATVLFLLRLPQPKSPEPFSFGALARKLDLIGTAIFLPAIICLLFSLQGGGKTYEWRDWRVILCLRVFGVLFNVWVFYQYRKNEEATVPRRIITQRSVLAAIWYTFTLYSYNFILTYCIPIWFQFVQNASAQQSGINYLAAACAFTLMSLPAGFLVSRDALTDIALLFSEYEG